MILRIWSCKTKPGFTKFIKEILLPKLTQHGCILSIAGRRGKKTTIITSWKNLAALKKFTGPNIMRASVLPEAKKFLKGKPQIEHLRVLSK